MIRNPPDAAALIGLVVTVLKQDLTNEQSDLSRYDRRLMIAALALAARELESGDGPLSEALAALSSSVTGLPEPSRGDGLATTLAALSRRLSAEIRDGSRDGDHGTYEALLRAARAYLAESNPKALARDR